MAKKIGKTQRRVELVRPLTESGVGVLAIIDPKETAFYEFIEIPCQIGGRGFRLRRIGRDQIYDLRIGQPADTSCECKGFVYRDTCRHVLALRKLIEQGQI